MPLPPPAELTSSCVPSSSPVSSPAHSQYFGEILTVTPKNTLTMEFINRPENHMVRKPLEKWSVNFRLMSNHLITTPEIIGGKVAAKLTSLMNGTGYTLKKFVFIKSKPKGPDIRIQKTILLYVMPTEL